MAAVDSTEIADTNVSRERWNFKAAAEGRHERCKATLGGSF